MSENKELVVSKKAGLVKSGKFEIQKLVGDFDRQKAMAAALMDVVESERLKTRIGNKDHLHIEAWTFLGSMTGVVPMTLTCDPVLNDKSQIIGYKAVSEAKRVATDQIVGRGVACCMFNETKGQRRRWNDDHAAMAMAQTRANSRCLAQSLRHLVVLAGYSGTPFDDATTEMLDADAVEVTEAPAKPEGPPRISRAQVQRLWMQARKVMKHYDLKDEKAEEVLRDLLGQYSVPPSPDNPSKGPSTKMITVDRYEQIYDEISRWSPPVEDDLSLDEPAQDSDEGQKDLW